MRRMLCTLICLLTAACGDPSTEVEAPLAQTPPTPFPYPALPPQTTINIITKPVQYPKRIQ